MDGVAFALVETEPYLPEFTFRRALTDWQLDPWLFVVTVWIVGLYVFGVFTLRQRGDHWPMGRTFSFVVVGMGAFAFATMSGVGRYDTSLLSVHMVQHMILAMVVPMALALGAPVTLALRTLPRTPRRWLLAFLHSRFVRVLSFPPVAFGLYVLSPWALYFTGWFPATLDSEFLHGLMHVHLVLIGSLFFWPLMGVDPVPGRVAHPLRILMTLMTLPFHAFLGVTIMGATVLIGEDFFRALREGPMGAWLPGIAEDQYLAGGILWASGDLVGLMFFGVLFSQWVRDSTKEAAREDRRLDLLEARERYDHQRD